MAFNNDYLFSDPRSFLLISGKAKKTTLSYDGETFTVPEHDQIVMPNPKAPEKPFSGKDSEGNWIPGSLVLRDIPGVRGCPDDITGSIRGAFWNASEAIVHCLGINPQTREATSTYAESGIGVLGMSPTPEMVAQAKAELIEKWKQFRIKLANQTVNDTLEMAQARKKFGLTEGIPDKEYEEAVMVLEVEREARKAKLRGLGLPTIEDQLQSQGAGADHEDEDDDSALLAAAQRVAAKMKASDAELDYDKLVDMLLDDPKFDKALKIKRNVKKWPGTAIKKAAPQAEPAEASAE
jgi:hypothetical protein